MTTEATTTAKKNLFKAIGKAAGSNRRSKTEAEKCNYAALKNAAVNCETLRDGKRLVSATKKQYRTLNAQTTAETVFQLLKRNVKPEVIEYYSADGELPPVSERYDWKAIFTAAEADGVSLAELAKSEGVDLNQAAQVFGFDQPAAEKPAEKPAKATKATAKTKTKTKTKQDSKAKAA